MIRLITCPWKEWSQLSKESVNPRYLKQLRKILKGFLSVKSETNIVSGGSKHFLKNETIHKNYEKLVAVQKR